MGSPIAEQASIITADRLGLARSFTSLDAAGFELEKVHELEDRVERFSEEIRDLKSMFHMKAQDEFPDLLETSCFGGMSARLSNLETGFLIGCCSGW